MGMTRTADPKPALMAEGAEGAEGVCEGGVSKTQCAGSRAAGGGATMRERVQRECLAAVAVNPPSPFIRPSAFTSAFGIQNSALAQALQFIVQEVMR